MCKYGGDLDDVIEIEGGKITLGFARLFAVELCFAETAQHSLTAMPPFVKKYVKALFGANSPELRQISSLEYRPQKV